MFERILNIAAIAAFAGGAAVAAAPADRFADSDADGLPDYAVYVLSNTFSLAGADYFTVTGRQYVGEMMTDHDMMEDAFERSWREIRADPAVYDAHIDGDGDGWSNWAEIRARCASWNIYSTNSADFSYIGRPQPQVTATVHYNGHASLAGKSLRVEAWKQGNPDRLNAVFSVPWGDGRNVSVATFQTPSEGWLREGKTMFLVSVDNLLGVVQNVDVGWSKVEFEVELTEKSPICSRPVMPTNSTSQIYVYRYAVDGFNPPSSLEYGPILVKDIGNRGYLHEGDFLSDAEFDIDWTNFADEVLDNVTVSRYDLPVTSVVYRVYSSPVNIDQEAILASNATPYVAFSRDFGLTRAVANPVSPGEDSTILYGAQPTFRWQMEGEMPDSFTAFAIQIKSGSEVIWNSGTQIAPPRNYDGEYVWKAPLYVGDQTPLGKIFGNTNNYTWAVTMYNSKYQGDLWSTNRTFRVNVYGYGIDVAVKYFGPGAYRIQPTQTNGAIRVEAYTSPDFSGVPAGRTFVRTYASVTNAAQSVNATISGLPAGTYYVRAFIDSDGNFRRSPWESWGYACRRGDAKAEAIYAPAPFTVGEGIETPKAVVYVEDCDTDQDWLPDVWEYDAAGADKVDFLLRKGPRSGGGEHIGFNPDMLEM